MLYYLLSAMTKLRGIGNGTVCGGKAIVWAVKLVASTVIGHYPDCHSHAQHSNCIYSAHTKASAYKTSLQHQNRDEFSKKLLQQS